MRLRTRVHIEPRPRPAMQQTEPNLSYLKNYLGKQYLSRDVTLVIDTENRDAFTAYVANAFLDKKRAEDFARSVFPHKFPQGLSYVVTRKLGDLYAHNLELIDGRRITKSDMESVETYLMNKLIN